MYLHAEIASGEYVQVRGILSAMKYFSNYIYLSIWIFQNFVDLALSFWQ